MFCNNIALASTIAGAISATVYVRNGTPGDMKKVLRRIINGRKNIGLHLVYENGVRDRLLWCIRIWFRVRVRVRVGVTVKVNASKVLGSG